MQLVSCPSAGPKPYWARRRTGHCTEVRFASFISGEFTTMAVINSPERKLANRIPVHWIAFGQISFREGRQDVASKLGRR